MMQQEAKRQQKVPLHIVSRRFGVPELVPGLYMLWGVQHQPQLALGIQGEDGHRHPESTRYGKLLHVVRRESHLYLTVVDMPRAVTEHG